MGVTGVASYGAGTPYEVMVRIQAVESENADGVIFTATVAGVADLRGLFFDVGGAQVPYTTQTNGRKTIEVPFADTELEFSWARGAVVGDLVTGTRWGEGLVNDLGNGANVKGGFDNPVTSLIEDGKYDFGVEYGTQGIGSDDIRSASFFLEGVTLAEIENQAFAVRLTSTDNPDIEGVDREGSLKLTGIFDPPGDDEGDATGFSHGYWKTHGPDAKGNNENDWDVEGDPFFEKWFGITSDWDWITGAGKNPPTEGDITFSTALGLTKSGQYALAREATAAFLNSKEEDVDYEFTGAQVIAWTNAVFDWTGPLDTGYGSWGNQQDAIFGLKDLFESYNVREPMAVV